jgi:hypothetical protein
LKTVVFGIFNSSTNNIIHVEAAMVLKLFAHVRVIDGSFPLPHGKFKPATTLK